MKSRRRTRRGALLLAIIAFKFFKSFLFFAPGAALLLFRQEPTTRFLLRAAAGAESYPRLGMSAHALRDLSRAFQVHFPGIVSACLIAGVFLAAEGICLWLGYTWAPWFTIALTGMWIPLEVRALAGHFTIHGLVFFAVNLLIVLYLYDHRKDFHRHLEIA